MHLFDTRVAWITVLIATCTVAEPELPPNATSHPVTAARLRDNQAVEENLKKVKDFFEHCKALASRANVTALGDVSASFSIVLGMLGPAAEAISAIVDSFIPGAPSDERKAIDALHELVSDKFDELKHEMIKAVDKLAEVFAMWTWLGEVNSPIAQVEGTLEAFYSLLPKMQEKQERRPVIESCEKYDTGDTLISMWSSIGYMCGRFGEHNEYKISDYSDEAWYANDTFDVLRNGICVPDLFMQKRNFSSESAQPILTLLTSTVSALSFLTANCMGVAWNGTSSLALQHQGVFNTTASTIAQYLQKALPQLMSYHL